MNVNDGTTPCPTCLSAASMSTLKAVADLRTQLAAMTARAEAAEQDRDALAQQVRQDAPRTKHVDHACAQCVPGGEIVANGFECVTHLAMRLIADATERGDYEKASE